MKAVDTVVKNCKIVRTDGIAEAGLAIKGGKFVAIATDGHLPPAETVVDAKGNHVFPGIIDPHAHLQDAYYTHEQLVESESRSAAGGGVTTLIPTILNRADPLVSFKEVLPRSREIVEKKSTIDMAFSAVVGSEDHVNEFPEYVKELGTSSFKFYTAYKKEEAKVFGVNPVDDGVIMAGFEMCAKLGYPVLPMAHMENMEIIFRLKSIFMAEGRQDLSAYSEARPEYAEEEMIRRLLYFAEITGSPLYLVHLSMGSVVPLIRECRKKGMYVVGETCPHYLVYTQHDHEKIGRLGTVNPPLRDRRQQELLWAGIRDGDIRCVGSDHSTIMPVTEKDKGDLWTAIPGYPGTEMILPIMLSEGVHKGRISLERLVDVCSTSVAKVFGIYPRKGDIRVGGDADLVVVDLQKKMTVTSDILHSAADYTIYDGMEVTGWPILTMVRGRVVMQDGEIVGEPGWGTYIPRDPSQFGKVPL